MSVRKRSLRFAEYHQLLGRHMLPSRVAATKVSTDTDSDWCFGDDRSIYHDCWVLEGNAEARLADRIVSFDDVVDRYGKRLNDPSLRGDLLTKKILCIRSLVSGPVGRAASNGHLINRLNDYDFFVRWRLSLGIKRNNSLKDVHFRDYLKKIAAFDPITVVPWQSRLDEMFERNSHGTLDFELIDEGKVGGIVSWESIANFLGLTSHSISKSTVFRIDFGDRFASLPYPEEVHARLRRSLETPAFLKALATESYKIDRKADKSLTRYLDTWSNLLWLTAQKVLTHDPLNYDPFRDKSKRSLKKELGSGEGRTSTLHPDDFLRLIALCSRWVVVYAPYILEATKLLQEKNGFPLATTQEAVHRRTLEDDINDRRPEGSPRIALIWHEGTQPKIPREFEYITLRDAVKYLHVASLILLCCFSARRISEIMSLKAGCVRHRGRSLYIDVFIHKTVQHSLEVPVPELVETTVTMLETLSASTRKRTGEPWLFHVAKGSLKPKSFIGQRLDSLLNEFVNYAQLPPPVGQSEWSLATHQFRRGFAVFYFHGFEWSSIESVSLFLGHYDPGMSEIYVNEVLPGEIGRLRDILEGRAREHRAAMTSDDRKDLKELIERLESVRQDFREAEREAYVLRMLKVHRHEEQPIGRGAARLYSDLRSAQRHAQALVRVGSRANSDEEYTERLIDQLKQQAYSRFLRPNPDHSVLCNADQARNTDVETRECYKLSLVAPSIGKAQRTAIEIVRAFSSANPCLKCIHGVLFQQQQRTAEAKLHRLDESRRVALTPEAEKNAHDLFLEYEASLLAAANAAAGTA